MPFKKTKKGWVYDKNGKYQLPPASPALQKIKGLVITWDTPVLPAYEPEAPKKHVPKPKGES